MTRGVALLLALVGGWAFAGPPPSPPGSPRLALRWREVPGASGYELQIAKDSAFEDVVLQTRTPTAGYRWDELPKTPHWWRVRSLDADGRPSEWSAPRTVAIDSVVPELKRPAPGAVLHCQEPLTAELAASPLVREYGLELATSPRFEGARELRQPGPLFELGALAPGNWYLRAKAVDVKGAVLGPGPAHGVVVRLAAPKPKPTPDVPLGGGVSLAWGEVACAKSWLVETVVDGKDRASVSAPQPSLALKPTVAGEHRWRVAAVDERGVAGEWSPEAVFHVKLPAPVPKPEVVSGHLELSWGPVPSAVSYRIELHHGALGAEPTLVGNAATPSWRSPDLVGGAWVWRVEARDARGHVSAWSEPRRVERARFPPLPTPALSEPPELVAVDGTATVTWPAVPGATSFEVELDGQPLPPLEASTTRYTTPALAAGWHAVRVRALQVPLRESAWSALREVCAGPRPVARVHVELEAQSTLRVTLWDKHDHLLRGQPVFTVARGRLGTIVDDEGEWRLRWAMPELGDDTLHVEEDGFSQDVPLHRPEASNAWVAAGLGGRFNFSSVHSPQGQLVVGYHLPVLERRLGLEARLGVFEADARASVLGAQVTASVWLLPVSVLADWVQKVGPYLLKVAAGPALMAALVSVGDSTEQRLVFAGHLAVSASYAIGPGRLALELDGLYGRLDTSLVRLHAGGLGVTLLYQLDL